VTKDGSKAGTFSNHNFAWWEVTDDYKDKEPEENLLSFPAIVDAKFSRTGDRLFVLNDIIFSHPLIKAQITFDIPAAPTQSPNEMLEFYTPLLRTTTEYDTLLVPRHSDRFVVAASSKWLEVFHIDGTSYRVPFFLHKMTPLHISLLDDDETIAIFTTSALINRYSLVDTVTNLKQVRPGVCKYFSF
jgi:hypothetical protein